MRTFSSCTQTSRALTKINEKVTNAHKIDDKKQIDQWIEDKKKFGKNKTMHNNTA